MSSEKPLPEQPKRAQRESDFYDMLAWMEVNKQKVFVAAVVVVVLGFIIATVRYMREQKEIKASSQLLAMRVTLNPATNAVPPQASEFLKIAEDFSGTSAAERARLLAATTLFTNGKYAEAEAEFNRFKNDFRESPWIASAAYGVAAAQEAQKKQEALASYQAITTAYANSPVADDAKLAIARIYETRNQPDLALRTYNELLAPVPGALPGQSGHPGAASRREALLRAHPELDTNTTSSASATQVAPVNNLLRLPSGTNAEAGTNSGD